MGRSPNILFNEFITNLWVEKKVRNFSLYIHFYPGTKRPDLGTKRPDLGTKRPDYCAATFLQI
jgi:hypothetical protein